MSRNEFMGFFRDDDSLNSLSNDDRIEIFRTILSGGSDLTKDLLNEVLADYSVSDIEVIEVVSERRERELALIVATLHSESLTNDALIQSFDELFKIAVMFIDTYGLDYEWGVGENNDFESSVAEFGRQYFKSIEY